MRDARLNMSLENYLVLNGYLPETSTFPPLFVPKIVALASRSKLIEREPIQIAAPKSLYSWRDFSIIHPANFEHLVRLVASPDYKKIVASLIGSNTKIGSYSFPLRAAASKRKESQVSQWVQMNEDIGQQAGVYKYLVQTDIANCYHTMYTHAIEWACRDVLGCHAANKRCDTSCFGNRLDHAIRSGMSGRTHGLPVGPRVTDYVAELCLLWLDHNLEAALQGDGIAYEGCRYKDNYYLLCNSEDDANSILKILSREARRMNLHINSDKTSIQKTADYLVNFWQNEFERILTLLPKEKWSYFQVRAYLSKVYELSAQYGHGKAIIDKALRKLRDWQVGLKLAPDKIKEVNSRVFDLVSALCVIRPESIPAAYAYLESLTIGLPTVMGQYNAMIARSIDATDARDSFFELLWLVYFAIRANNPSIIDSAISKLQTVISDPHKRPIVEAYIKVLNSIKSGQPCHGLKIELFADASSSLILEVADPRRERALMSKVLLDTWY